MLACLVLFNIFHPGRLMPGKESDFPSRKQRKAAGKNNTMGRAAMALPLHERSSSNPDEELGSHGRTYPKADGSSVTYGYATDE